MGKITAWKEAGSSSVFDRAIAAMYDCRELIMGSMEVWRGLGWICAEKWRVQELMDQCLFSTGCMDIRKGGTGPGLGCCRMGARQEESQHEIYESSPGRSAPQLAEQFAGLQTSGSWQLEPGAHGLSLDVQNVEELIGKAFFLLFIFFFLLDIHIYFWLSQRLYIFKFSP